jgi:hypothetical protein
MPAERQPARLDPRPRDPEPILAPAPSAPGKELTINKVLACAGAAATSALVGSLFGVEGTVLGAAVGSAVSTVATAIYQRSLDRTRETVRARIKLPGGRALEVAAPLDVPDVPAPRVSPEGETGLARAHVTPAPRRRLARLPRHWRWPPSGPWHSSSRRSAAHARARRHVRCVTCGVVRLATGT